MQTPDDLRREVQRHIRRDIPDGVWTFLIHDGYAEDVLLDPGNVDKLDSFIEVCRKLTAGNQRSAKSPPQVPTAGATPDLNGEHAWALSRLAAAEADDDPEVQGFRTRHLNNKLVPWNDLENWINTRAEADGPLTRRIELTLPEGISIEQDKGGWLLDPPLLKVGGIKVFAECIKYAGPEDEWVKSIYIASTGTLGQLHNLVRSLMSCFPWSEPQTVAYVVCGITPFIPPIQTRISAPPIRYSRQLSWTRRITLTIDPTTPSEAVIAEYNRTRSEIGLRNPRQMSVRHLRLAVYATIDHTNLPWRERMNSWNAEFPQWKYVNCSNFRRDALHARKAILNPVNEEYARRRFQEILNIKDSKLDGDSI